MDVEYELLGKNKVVISLKDFENMLDIISYDKIKFSTEEFFPATFTEKLIQGESPLRAFRKHRNMSQTSLAEISGVAQSMISDIEKGKKTGSVAALKALATTLNIGIDDLIAL